MLGLVGLTVRVVAPDLGPAPGFFAALAALQPSGTDGAVFAPDLGLRYAGRSGWWD